MIIEKQARQFLPENLAITDFQVLEPYFKDLLERQISSLAEFDKWLKDRSELDAVLEEDLAWRYIRMSINTQDEQLRERYNLFVSQIQPELAPLEDQLNKKLVALPYLEERQDAAHQIYFRAVRSALALFREENISIEAALNEEAQQFGAISAAQTIEHEGKELTMQQAALLLKDQNESLRQTIFEKIVTRRRQDREKLDALYSSLIEKRTQLAKNAGFENYRDYKFAELGRFDYTKEDCFQFHEAVKLHVMPLIEKIYTRKKEKLGVDIENLIISQPDNGEQALEIAENLIRSGAIDIVVIDSVAALTPKSEIEGEMGDSKMGLHARLMSQALRKLTGTISKTHCTVFFINQLREKIGVMFGNPETTTGGNALKFYASVRLDIRRSSQIKDGDNVIGNRTKVKVVKNKVAPPFKTAEFDIMYGEGVSKTGEILDLAVEFEIIKKSGSWFSYGDTKLGQGRDAVKALIKDNPELADELEEKIKSQIKELAAE